MWNLRSQVSVLIVLAIVIAVGSLAVILTRQSRNSSAPRPTLTPATHVGSNACIECHQGEYDQWKGSHHDLAMQPANEQTVLGDFNNATFTHFGVTSRFYKKDGKFFVQTDGPDGQLHDYEISYTFGVYPLQQYLIGFPDGRYQALSILWDSRPKEQGGQRWYHLYADEPIPHTDELHWTGPNQNWNFMCAECHSTNLKKNYDLKTNTFNTTWSQIDVSCEACHGPASNHVRWARDYERGLDWQDPKKGLDFTIPRDGAGFVFAPGQSTAQRTQPRTDRAMIEMCARCHSRRATLTEDYQHGKPLLDTHRLSLLEENLYFADGQIQDEVYVYGSFLQSRMYHQSVTCTDCHNPHTLKTHAPGNALCAQCHLPEKYDTPQHHFHQQDTEASQCVACHMPTRTYMGVDERLDHSIRIPRPDLSVQLGTPNACTKCHDDQNAQWAADAVAQWYGKQVQDTPHFGRALAAGRNHAPDAEAKLIRLINDSSQPSIVRATAAELLREYPSSDSYQTISRLSRSPEPMIRFAAAIALEAFSPEDRLPIAYAMLDDPVLAVRLEAARVLAPVSLENLDPLRREAIEKGLDAYIQSQLVNADRAESHLNIALVYVQQGHYEEAEASYKTAIRLNPRFVQAHVNLADLYRQTQRDSLALQTLNRAIDELGLRHGVLYHARGLTHVRMGHHDKALADFSLAAETTPEDPNFAYTLAVAYNSLGRPEQAIRTLERNLEQHPDHLPSLYAMMTFNRDMGRIKEAIRYAEQLRTLDPDNAASIENLIRQLQTQPKEYH